MPVYLDDADAGEIPAVLKGYPRFHLNKLSLDDAGSDYVNLYRLLTKQPSAGKVDIGEIHKSPPLTQRERQMDFTQPVEQILAGVVDVKSDTRAILEKTVFMAYRRTTAPWALAIFQNLIHHGYDVFYDFTGIASGDFERVILENIKARAHFLVLLTPSALERCGDPSDWLRREIETALQSQRNIVPIMLEGFDFSSPAIAKHLTGKLTTLKNYNALHVPAEYFHEAMTRLREKYLNVPLDAVLHPPFVNAQQVAKDADANVVKEKEVTGQEWFEQGYEGNSPTEAARALRTFANAPGLSEDANQLRLALILEVIKAEGAPIPAAIASFIRDSRPETEELQAKVARRLGLIPQTVGKS